MNLIFTSELPSKEDIYYLYKRLGWIDFLKLSQEHVLTAMKGSWYSVYAYSGDKLVGTGRIVSDGIINAYLCGLGVDAEYRNQGIGTEIIKKLVDRCKEYNLHVQFFCEELIRPYYEKMGFEKFAEGMKLAESDHTEK